MSEKAAKDYLGAIKDSLNSPNMVLDLRIPQNQQYQQIVLDTAIGRLLAGEITVDQASADHERLERDHRGARQGRAARGLSQGTLGVKTLAPAVTDAGARAGLGRPATVAPAAADAGLRPSGSDRHAPRRVRAAGGPRSCWHVDLPADRLALPVARPLRASARAASPSSSSASTTTRSCCSDRAVPSPRRLRPPGRWCLDFTRPCRPRPHRAARALCATRRRRAVRGAPAHPGGGAGRRAAADPGHQHRRRPPRQLGRDPLRRRHRSCPCST